MKNRNLGAILGCILGLSLGVLNSAPVLAQCGTDATGASIPCTEGEERKTRPTEIPIKATVTATAQPTSTSTAVPTSTRTPLAAATMTPRSALIAPADTETSRNESNAPGWLPLAGPGLLLLLGLGFAASRLRGPRAPGASQPILDDGADRESRAGTSKGDKIKDTPR